MTSLPWATPAVAPRRVRAGHLLPRIPRSDAWSGMVGVLAGALVTAGILLGWRGGDLPAQIYRVQAIERNGLALWDSQWFAGHWMLGYSVLYPALAATIGLSLLSVLSAAGAALAFDRLVQGHFAQSAARAASLVFAVSLIVESAIGQLPFLAGESAGLWCVLALARRRPIAAVTAAVVSSVLSPLAAAFVALAATAWILGEWLPQRMADRYAPSSAGVWHRLVGTSVRQTGLLPALGTLLAIGVPLGLVGLLFPGQGPMPYPVTDCLWELAIAVTLWIIAPPTERVLRTGIVLFMITAGASLALPSALGGNVGRIEDCLALPLAVALLWPRRRFLLTLLAIPLILSVWGPAWNAMTKDAGRPWTSATYYGPLIRWLHHAGGRAGRVEVVPTADHWETAYVAPSVALARGWERQLDVADNPVFYDRGALSDSSYLTWLLDNGVRYVALPSAPLDYAGVAEGRLVADGVPGLREVMHTAVWRVYAVDGASGIVSGPGYLTGLDGSHMSVMVTRPGTVEVRVHDNPGWTVASGSGALAASTNGWILLDAVVPGPVDLALGLSVP